MKNLELAKIFNEIADILEIQDIQWKPQAYRKAASSIASLSIDIEKIYKKSGLKGLDSIPGVGKHLALKIEEYLKTGKIKAYKQLKKKVPIDLAELTHIEFLGPKKAKRLYKELKIKNIKDLEKAAKAGKIAKLSGFGEKSQQDILEGLGMYKLGKKRALLNIALPIAKEIIQSLNKLKEVKSAEYVGSLRRMKETVRDIDILVISNKPKKVIQTFTSLDNVKKVLAKGPTKASVVLKNNMHSDLRVLKPEEKGAGLLYFIGSKEHNIALRKIAIEKGYKLSEYGLFSRNTGKRIPGTSEKDIYKALSLKYIPPELRENQGEIEAAKKGKIPTLISIKDIKGDFHVHSKWSDGSDSIKDLATTAKKLGYQYLCISDHSKSEKIANGLSESNLLKQIKLIKKLNKNFRGFKLLAGSEVDILADGSLDYPEKILKQLDIVIGSIHSRFKSSKQEMTKRICTALENKHLNILGHPTGRLINQRKPYNLDLDQVFKVALENKKHLELNAFPNRLDLSDTNLKEAIELGLKISIGTDAHSKDQMNYMKFGVATARRGWCQKNHILNTFTLKQLPKYFKKL